MAFSPTRHGYYLGPVGRLVAVRPPASEGYNPEPDLAVATHRLLSGKTRTDRPAYSARTYSLSWGVMSDAEKAWLEQCSLGLVPGALYWVDPLVRNQLPPSVSAPIGVITAADFVGPGYLQYRPDGSQGFGGVDWVPTAGGSELTAMRRVPVVTGLPFTGSAWITRYDGASTSVSINIDWFDKAGAFISRQIGSGVALTTLAGAYRLTAATSSPPAGAVDGRLAIYVTDARSFRVDSWQVEYGALSTFDPGPGLAKVGITAYQPAVYLSGMTNVSMSMVEVL